MAGIKQGDVLDGYRFLGGSPGDPRSWESTRIARGTVDSGFVYMGGDPADRNNWEEAGGTARRVVGDTAVSAVKSVIGVPETLVGLADMATGGYAGKAAESLGFRPKEAKAALDELLTPEQRLANRNVQEADGFIGTAKAALRNPSTIFHTAVESSASLLPAGVVARGALAVVPRLGGALAAGIGEGVVSAGQTAEQIRQETADGLLTGQQSALAAGSGALTAVIGSVAGKIANRLGIGDIDQLVAGVQQAGPKAQKSFARALMEGFATEGVLQELPQSAQEQIAQNVALDRPWDEGVSKAAATGALSGGLMGAGAAPFGNASKRLATAQTVPEMIQAANDMVNAPLDFPTGEAAKDLLPKPQRTELTAELGAAPPPAAAPEGSIEFEPPTPLPDRLAGDLQLAPQQSLPWQPAPPVPASTADAIANADDVVPPVERAPRQRAEPVEMQPVQPAPPADPVVGFVEQMRQVATPQARAFVQDFNAGRITRRDVIRVMQSQGQDPLSPEQRLADAAAQAPAPAPDGIAVPQTYRSRTKATVEARKVGGTVEPVQGGFSVKEASSVEPDLAVPSTVAARPSDAPGDVAGGSGGVVGLRPDVGQRVGLATAAPTTRGEALAEPAAPADAGLGRGDATLNAPIDSAAHEAATSPKNDRPQPTEAQQAAGNYKVGRARIAGLDISIENPQGSTRSGVDPDGKPWSNEMQSHYGYIRGTEGKDGDHVDVFIKAGTPADYAGPVFVVDQVDPKTGRFDEHKSLIGFASEEEARAAYQASYAKDWNGLRAITPMAMDQFKAWVKDPARTKRPLVRFRGQSAPDATSPAPAQPPAARVIARVGRTPNTAQSVELRSNQDGTLTPHMEGEAMLDFDSGEPIKLPGDVTDDAAKQAIKAAGALSSKQNFYAPAEPAVKASRGTDSERAALAWRRTELNTEGPEFYGRDVSLIALRQMDTEDEFADNSLPLGHAVHVRKGNTAHKFLIADGDGGVLGEAYLEVNPAGKIDAVHDIEMTDKRAGTGRKVMEAILANANGPVRIVDILDQSEPFWNKMGAGYRDHYGNATADWESYRAAQGADKGTSPGTRPAPGGELEAGRTAEGEPQSQPGTGTEQPAGRSGESAGDAGGIEPKARRAPSPGGMSLGAAEKLAAAYEANGLNRVNVARNISELPEKLRKKLSGYGDDVRGAYFPAEDQVWVFSDKVPDAEALHFVVMHEAFHRGLGVLMGEQAQRVMRQMYATNKRLRDRADLVARELKISRDEAIEEALADMAGEGDVSDLRGWARLSKIITDWLARIGEAVGIKREFTDAEVQSFVAAMARAGVSQDPKSQARADGSDSTERRAPKASRVAELPDWVKQGPAALQSAAGKVDTFRPQSTFKEKVDGFRSGWKKRLVQGLFDAYAPLKELDYEAYVAARMAKSGDGVLEGMLMYGKPKMDASGAITGDLDGRGFLGAMQELQGEHDRFFLWIAGNRAKRLKVEGRENLFSDDEIRALGQLNGGSMPDGTSRVDAYRRASQVLATYNRSVLDVAEKAGIIDGEARSTWEHDFYVPFFRLSDDGTTAAPGRVKGLVRQKGIEKLKGGKEPLGDLMENTLRNWSQLINASLANQAARKALVAAEGAGVALEATEEATKDMAKTLGKKGSAVYFMDQGRQRWFIVDDPFVLDAVSSMESVQMNGLPMKIMGVFKRMLTFGVTVAPAFKVRNLIRDSVSAIAQSNLDFRVDRNLAQGWKATGKESTDYAQMLFGGGLMRFGTQLEGDRAAHVKRLINDGVKGDTILDTTEKAKAAALKLWDSYQDFGDRLENINRAALYKQRIEAGMSPQQAAFEARDLMDFSLQGSFTAVRFLTQVVPFLNARLQGLYKLGRSAKENPKRFGYVAGAVAMASIALLLAYSDDDDWKRREDWDRDGFWWFKVGGTAFRIPKPFELGAIGTIAERSVEMLISDEMNGKRFAERLRQMLSDTFAMNPVPQFFKPMLDLYANKDSFTGREIETQGMERHSKSERYGPNTTGLALLLGKAGGYTNLSPVQIDSLLKGYFGWLGSTIPWFTDTMATKAGLTNRPESQLGDWTGNLAKGLSGASSRYVTQFAEQSKSLEQFAADLKRARDIGDFEKARELVEDNQDKVGLVKIYRHAQTQMERISKQIRFVRESQVLSPEEKRERLDQLNEMRSVLAEAIERRRLATQH